MHWAPGAKNAARLGSTASFEGGKPADTWVSGASRPWVKTKADAAATLSTAKARLARPITGDSTDVAEREAAQEAVTSAAATINDMTSTISRAAVKEATYQRAFAVLAKKRAKSPAVQPVAP